MQGACNIRSTDTGYVSNITFNRCTVDTQYINDNADGHCQGLICTGVTNLNLIENIVYKGGWLNESDGTDPVGEATVFNHNFYISKCHDVLIYRNVSLCPSSMHFKFATADGYDASDINLLENLCVNGEIMASLGGNNDDEYRFSNILVQGNVICDYGYIYPTHRSISYGIEMYDWDGGTVKDNYILNATETSCLGVVMENTQRDVTIEDNLFYNVYQKKFGCWKH